jgi:hypothetical protein
MPQLPHTAGPPSTVRGSLDVPRGAAGALVKGTALRSLLLGLEQATSPADVARVRAALPDVRRRPTRWR